MYMFAMFDTFAAPLKHQKSISVFMFISIFALVNEIPKILLLISHRNDIIDLTHLFLLSVQYGY